MHHQSNDEQPLGAQLSSVRFAMTHIFKVAPIKGQGGRKRRADPKENVDQRLRVRVSEKKLRSAPNLTPTHPIERARTCVCIPRRKNDGISREHSESLAPASMAFVWANLADVHWPQDWQVARGTNQIAFHASDCKEYSGVQQLATR